MELVSYQEYLAYSEMVKYVFLLIGLIAFFYYNKNIDMEPLSKLSVWVLVLMMVVLLGGWPMIEGGIDRNIYYAEAEYIARTRTTERMNDPGYFFVNYLLTLFPMNLYFYLHAFVYVIGIYIFAKSIFPRQYGALFIAMILYFQFVSYGVNTMRAGLAGSFVLIALSFRERRLLEWTLLFVAVMIHKSFALPVLCYLIADRYDRTDLFFRIWLLSIPLSAVAGGFFQSHFAGLLGDESRVSYLTTAAQDTHYQVGFRIDFILFSCAPIVMGYYLIYKRGFQDRFYKTLFNTYLLANTFWIFVIRANFSDRFAYLSWFIYCPVLLYPLLKNPEIVPNSHKWVAFSILALTLFRTYLS